MNVSGPDGTVNPHNLGIVAPLYPPCTDEAACDCWAAHIFTDKKLAAGHEPLRVGCWCQPKVEVTLGGVWIVEHQCKLA